MPPEHQPSNQEILTAIEHSGDGQGRGLERSAAIVGVIVALIGLVVLAGSGWVAYGALEERAKGTDKRLEKVEAWKDTQVEKINGEILTGLADMKAELRALKDQNRIAAEQMKGLQDQIREINVRVR